MPTELSKAPNLGKVVTDKLKKAGINDLETLREVGSENAYIRVRAIDNEACICMLYGLEGAVQGIRWHNLPDIRKNELKEFYKTLGDVKHSKHKKTDRMIPLPRFNSILCLQKKTNAQEIYFPKHPFGIT